VYAAIGLVIVAVVLKWELRPTACGLESPILEAGVTSVSGDWQRSRLCSCCPRHCQNGLVDRERSTSIRDVVVAQHPYRGQRCHDVDTAHLAPSRLVRGCTSRLSISRHKFVPVPVVSGPDRCRHRLAVRVGRPSRRSRLIVKLPPRW